MGWWLVGWVVINKKIKENIGIKKKKACVHHRRCFFKKKGRELNCWLRAVSSSSRHCLLIDLKVFFASSSRSLSRVELIALLAPPCPPSSLHRLILSDPMSPARSNSPALGGRNVTCSVPSLAPRERPGESPDFFTMDLAILPMNREDDRLQFCCYI